MKGWTDLKEAFWAVVDGDAGERSRQIAALASIDPTLAVRLEALLAADERGESIQHFEVGPAPTRPERIAGYGIVGVLGVGGMGEVYRARDVRLQRDVAIKVLPADLMRDPERLARFEREAQVLASLNHRHIAQVYGLDESHGTPALVMECVEGPTLAEVIAGSADARVPLARALTIARQIADGLDAAHEKGIIHRDLKPGNVALTGDGEVKILDFGVAKTLEKKDPKAPLGPIPTEAGMILGTPAYMSPEQARGLPVDKRTDIWSFGCLVYELLTGRQPYTGNTPSDTLAAVLEHEPDWTILSAETPPVVRSLVRHCLEKDPKRRLRDIADARLTIDDALSRPTDEPSTAEMRLGGSSRPRGTLLVPALWLLAGVALTSTAALGLMSLAPAPSTADDPRRTIVSIVLPRGMQLAGSGLAARGSETRFAVSPDGKKLVVVAADESRRARLWIRELGSAAFGPLPETEDASSPFWSPDSKSIAFVAAGKLRTIKVAGGTPVTVHNAAFHSGAWSHDNLLLFAPAASSPLVTIPASGGTLSPATRLDTAGGEVRHGNPAFLPDGRHFVYFSIGSPSGALDPRGVYLGSLDSSGPGRLLVPSGTQPRYANGYLFFVQNGTLLAQQFDVETNSLRGVPAPLVEDVTLSTFGATGSTAAYSVSDRVLAYQAAVRTESRLIWFDRSGRQLSVLSEPGDYGDVALSPDGTRLATSVRDPAHFTRDLWLYDADDGRAQRVTFESGEEFAPVWSPDGKRLLFSAMIKGLVDLRVKDVHSAGDGAPIEVDNRGLGRFAADWSRDGRFLLYVGGGRAISRSDLWIAPVGAPREAHALLDSQFIETQPRVAPSGGWFLYASDETGQLEVYADRFPERGAKRLVSTGGGGWPRWAADGSEIFYVSRDDRLMAVSVRTTGDTLEIGSPRPLFALRPRPPARLDAYSYDVSLDGRRFVVNTVIEDPTSATITLVLDWAAALTKR